ncbi:MAG TPA: SulP family inorganic anion transporter [Caulobacteraceae bacterium]|jgi:MFS superfamily sulfate permease-like transporter|nr:SulP family inorganic anion transporter [Caulobacteraceae bacterium]
MATARPWPVFRALQGPSIGRDLAAGLTLAAIAIPEQMATARLAGLPPQIGLIAFIAATVGFAAFGASRLVSVGADSTIAPIFAGALATLAAIGTPQYAALAAALALLVGAFLVIAGVLRLGWIANLLSQPVTSGFLAGIAVHIVISQAPAALGLPDESGDVYHRLAALAAAAGHVNWIAAAIALAVFAVTLGAEKLSPRLPGALIALAGATIATAALGLHRQGVAVLGALPAALPMPAVPRLDLEHTLPLVSLAMVISLVAMLQTAATARSFAAGGADPDIDRDYIGVGVANAAAGLFGAFPVNASPPRTAAVAQAGGVSQYAGLAAAVVVGLLLAFGGRLLADAPAAALAGVLFFVAGRLVRWSLLAEILSRTPAEFALALLTTGLIVALPTETGVAIGMFLSLAHGAYTITRARLIPFERVGATTVWWPAAKAQAGPAPADVLVMGFQAPLSFLNAHDFRRDALSAIGAAAGNARLFVLEASSIVEIDFTAASALLEVIARSRAAGIDFAVARLESVRAAKAFARFGVTALLGEDHIFRSVAEAIAALAPGSAAGQPGNPPLNSQFHR